MTDLLRDGNTPWVSGVLRRLYADKLQAFQNRCAYCPSRAQTRDHILPVSRGGGNGIGNVNPCCLCCNQLKGDLLPDEWEAFRVAAGIGFSKRRDGWLAWQQGRWVKLVGRPTRPTLASDAVTLHTSPMRCPLCGWQSRDEYGRRWKSEGLKWSKHPLGNIGQPQYACPECGTRTALSVTFQNRMLIVSDPDRPGLQRQVLIRR